MTHILYTAPDDETRILDPSPEQIADIILNSDFGYWQQGGNGEACIEVVQRAHVDNRAKGSLISSRLATDPCLLIKQPEPELFFCNRDWTVPYNGDSCEEFVTDECGGDEFRIPRACLVAKETAATIAAEFVRSLTLSRIVRWESWYDLPMPREIYDIY
jgi:hypothetical protein